jgi:hypothetical protein
VEFEFHPDQWLRIAQEHPVILVLIGGALGGSALTQAVKLTYLAWCQGMHPQITDARFRNSVMWLAILSTFLFTNELWENLIGEHGSGLRHVVSVTSGISAPLTYKTVRALVAWKFPGFAAKWFSGTL